MSVLPNLIEIINSESIQDTQSDDILICCGSPEERCKGIIEKLSPNYKANNVFLLRYGGHLSLKRERNISDMKEKLKTAGKIFEFTIDEENPIPILNDVIQDISRYTKYKKNPKISIDITTIVKWHLLIILKGLDLKNIINDVRFFYTEPEDYETNLFQPLSFGIRKMFPIPMYSGDYNFSKDTLLILLLGYEGNRALALLEEIDPTDCLLLIAKPAYHDDWEGRTEEMNKGIINIIGKSKIEYVDSRNPVLISRQLQTILGTPKYSKYNHIISPLGTKPQTLGLYLYLSHEPKNTVLIYGSPLRHNELFYSHGVGKSWILPYKRNIV